ncbi:MAG TPA: response regulator transcription factor [Spirochaetia bacterium]|nr:response regulator transcription factor [Spirochaetia bacterium]
MLRILLCDDHPIVREGLKNILLQQSDIKVVEEAGSGGELLQKNASARFDVIILDITLPDMNGLEVLKNLRSAAPAPAVLVLSMHPEEQYATRALKAGAAGYLQKESAPAELMTAVRKIARGGRYVTPSLAEKLALDLAGPGDREPHELLSDREYQVLTLIASGRGIKEIALELALSAPTVATYRSRLMAKLGLASTVDLVRYALEHKLVD